VAIRLTPSNYSSNSLIMISKEFLAEEPSKPFKVLYEYYI